MRGARRRASGEIEMGSDADHDAPQIEPEGPDIDATGCQRIRQPAVPIRRPSVPLGGYRRLTGVLARAGMELFTAAVTSRESAEQPYTVVKLSGEADITVSGKLRDTLDAEVSRQPGRLIIDLSALRFMDSSALHVILVAGKTLAARGGAMALTDPQRPVSTVLRLKQADQVLAAAAR
jgi:anti-sigma B factor antagonist